MGSMNLKPGILRLQPWYPNFNPNTQSSTNSQIWVRFHELPWVYWDRQILSDLARGVGVPIRFDEMTLKGEFGHFARILIDVDLSQPLSDSLMVEVGTDCFFVSLEYERLPDFCTSCKTIGHLASVCRRGKPLAANKDSEHKVVRGRSRSRKRVYRPITKSPIVTSVPVKNTFAALKKDLVAEIPIPEKVSRDDKKSWADELDAPIDESPIVTSKEEEALAQDKMQPSAAASVGVLDNVVQLDSKSSSENVALVASDNVAPILDQFGASTAEGSESDSFNTSDFSPSKVFRAHDEGWQEVQSRKKKKAPQAPSSRPVTRSSKVISQ